MSFVYFFFPFVTFPLICLPRILCQNCRLPFRHYQASDKQVVFTPPPPSSSFSAFLYYLPPRGTASKGIADHVCWARSVPGGHGHRWGSWGGGRGGRCNGAGSCFGQALSQANSDLLTHGPLCKDNPPPFPALHPFPLSCPFSAAAN